MHQEMSNTEGFFAAERKFGCTNPSGNAIMYFVLLCYRKGADCLQRVTGYFSRLICMLLAVPLHKPVLRILNSK